jgi:signal-transduction protein with cAMP-binding, CBS, and nucleotidyltransferase domain
MGCSQTKTAEVTDFRPSSKEDAARLEEVPLFKNVPSKNLRKLLKDGERRIVQKKEVLVREGDEDRNFFVILDGRFQISVEEGKRLRPVFELQPGDYLGEHQLLHGGSRPATVTALEPSRVFVLGSALLDRLGLREDVKPAVPFAPQKVATQPELLEAYASDSGRQDTPSKRLVFQALRESPARAGALDLDIGVVDLQDTAGATVGFDLERPTESKGPPYVVRYIDFLYALRWN